MRKDLLVFFCFLVLWPGTSIAIRSPHLELAGMSAEEKGRAIFEAADARASGYADLQVDLQMVLRNSLGAETHRALRIRQLEVPDDGDKLVVVFDTPKPIKGTALLSFSHKQGPDDQWLYLPAMKRVKKIASRNRSGPFLSSEFAYEDLVVQDIGKFAYRYLREDEKQGLACYVVERTPVDGYSGYSRQVVWLDQAELRVQRIEYFDRRDDPLKTLVVEEYAKYQDRFWKAGRMEMVNHQTRKSTELFWRNYRFDTGLLDERDFSTNSLLRIR